MKIGVKIFANNKDYARKMKNHVDFFEVVAEEGKNYSFLDKVDRPFIIHAEDFKFQSNLANPENNSASVRYLTFAFELLKRYKAPYIILNPGIRFNNKCVLQNHIELFKQFQSKKILIENQPPLKNRTYPFFARNYDEAYEMTKRTGAGLCLDLAHAYASSFFYERDTIKFCKDIADLRPRHFHISNGKNDSFIDYHLHFTVGDFNMMAMKEIIPENAWVTIDTANDLEMQLEEIKFLRS